MKIRVTKIALLRILIIVLVLLIAALLAAILMRNSTAAPKPTPTSAPTVNPFTTAPPTEVPTAVPTPAATPTPAPTADYAARRAEILLVNLYHRLADDYLPGELVTVVNYITADSIRSRSGDTMIDRTTAAAANRMFEAAARDGVYGFVLTTAYRPKEFQQTLYSAEDRPVNDQGYYMVVPPFASEHRTGLAFDITNEEMVNKPDSLLDAFGQSGQGRWLAEHCWEYGFIIRYPVGKEEITRISYEPWHLRYVGVEHAMAIRASGECLEEYLGEVEPA